MPPHPLIHINGFPGTGKSTVVEFLVSSPLILENLKLINTNFVLSPADAVLHRTQPGYQALQRVIRQATFKFLTTEPETYHTTYLFTDFQTNNEQGAKVCEEYMLAAQERGCLLIPILLTCEEEENIKRMMGWSREGNAKLMDAELLKSYRRGTPILKFGDRKEFLEINVTYLKPEKVADIIWKHVLQCYPDLGGGWSPDADLYRS